MSPQERRRLERAAAAKLAKRNPKLPVPRLRPIPAMPEAAPKVAEKEELLRILGAMAQGLLATCREINRELDRAEERINRLYYAKPVALAGRTRRTA